MSETKVRNPVFQKYILEMGKPNIYCLKTEPQEHGDRCNAEPLEKGVRICVFSIHSDQPCLKENPAREGTSFGQKDANMANPVLLFLASNVVYTETINSSTNKNYVGKPTRSTISFQKRLRNLFIYLFVYLFIYTSI